MRNIWAKKSGGDSALSMHRDPLLFKNEQLIDKLVQIYQALRCIVPVELIQPGARGRGFGERENEGISLFLPARKT